MISSLSIENFKGVAGRQRVEFAPITLLFGANSAGKSTVLHALAYVHELLTRGEADVDRTHLGGHVLELGGFARAVHLHDHQRTMRFRLAFETPGNLNRALRDLPTDLLADIDDGVESAWIELIVESRPTTQQGGPQLARALIGVGDEATALVQLELGPNVIEGEPLFVRINLAHPLLAADDGDLAERWRSISLPEAGVTYRRDAHDDDNHEDDEPTPGVLRGLDGAIDIDTSTVPMFVLRRTRPSAIPPLDEPLHVLLATGEDPDADQAAILDEVRTFLELVVQGTTAQLVAHLERAAYLGPLRAVPPRGFLYQRAGGALRWADGLAAWDLLLSDRARLVNDTNARLRRLDAGCLVEVQHLVAPGSSAEDVSHEHVDIGVRRLLLRGHHADDTTGALALPAEVGSGIAQVLPVIVAALAPRVPFVMIEQPELHVHPRLQTELGDLFIEASANRQFLIETHSEHLILRLLRRIRETADAELPRGAPRFTPDRLSVMHVERTSTGAVFRRLRVDESGEFVDRWPAGFFSERAGELF
jgi:hypothetical protein